MGMYRLTCPFCQNVMVLEKNDLGTIVHCTQCYRPMKTNLPKASSKGNPAPVRRKEEFEQRPREGNKRKKTKPGLSFGNPWAVAVAGTAVVGIAILLVWSIASNSTPTSSGPADEQAKGPQPKPDPVLPAQPDPKNDHAGNKDPIPAAVKEPKENDKTTPKQPKSELGYLFTVKITYVEPFLTRPLDSPENNRDSDTDNTTCRDVSVFQTRPNATGLRQSTLQDSHNFQAQTTKSRDVSQINGKHVRAGRTPSQLASRRNPAVRRARKWDYHFGVFSGWPILSFRMWTTKAGRTVLDKQQRQ